MNYDLYVELGGETQKDVDAVVRGEYKDLKLDVPTRIRMLAGIVARAEGVKDYAVSGDRKQGGGYKSLVHTANPQTTPYAGEIRLTLQKFSWLTPSSPALEILPPGSWFLQFTFTLAKPWMSKDDDPFYVTESVNPLRKDKVFKLPVMSAASWKGLLRWTLMHTRLAQPVIASPQGAKQSPNEFAKERFAQSLLFGDEKGEEPGQVKDFAAYLDELGGKEARQEYEQLLRVHYQVKPEDPLPHHSGRLMFYPTFFNQIDVEVINPHLRDTKAGTHPIYLECVPAGAQGTFCLLYVPFDLIGQGPQSAKEEAGKHLRYLAPAIQQLFLTYGFSAKRTSGYGVAEDEIQGMVKTTAGEWKLTRLSQLKQEVANVSF